MSEHYHTSIFTQRNPSFGLNLGRSVLFLMFGFLEPLIRLTQRTKQSAFQIFSAVLFNHQVSDADLLFLIFTTMFECIFRTWG